MNEVIEFRQNAADCRMRAARTSSFALRTELLQQANHWTMLASEYEKCLVPSVRPGRWLH